MKEWNVVITVFQDGFRCALRALRQLGEVERGHFHNVLSMKVDDPMALFQAVEQKTVADPALCDAISRVDPAMHTIEFHSAEEFREKAKSAVLEWIPQLAGHRPRGRRPGRNTGDRKMGISSQVIAVTGAGI